MATASSSVGSDAGAGGNSPQVGFQANGWYAFGSDPIAALDVEDGNNVLDANCRGAGGLCVRPVRPLRLWLAAGHPAACLFVGLLGVASRHLFVPGGVKSPSPSFGDRTANHCLESPGFADGALVDVD